MTGLTCPACGSDAVCSRRELVAVYDWREIVREAADELARTLREYGVLPEPAEDAGDLCHRWADGETDGPELVCASCVTPHSRVEVSR